MATGKNKAAESEALGENTAAKAATKNNGRRRKQGGRRPQRRGRGQVYRTDGGTKKYRPDEERMRVALEMPGAVTREESPMAPGTAPEGMHNAQTAGATGGHSESAKLVGRSRRRRNQSAGGRETYDGAGKEAVNCRRMPGDSEP